MKELRDSRVLVTGSGGFLGRHLHAFLRKAICLDGGLVGTSKTSAGPSVTVNCDLLDGRGVNDLFRLYGPFDVVFHLAGFNGGIAWNLKFPADIFCRSTMMGLNLLEGCVRHGVPRVVSLLSSCAYPDSHDGLYEEDVLLDGRPHETVACHGVAKRNLQWASKFYSEQYGTDAVCLCLPHLYGPGDSYDPERTKVLGAMVKRFVDARREGRGSTTVWGSGRPLREFLYVEDAARIVARVGMNYCDSTRPLNIGSGHELSVGDLARLVAKAAGYEGDILFDASKPDGQLRKRLDLRRMAGYWIPTNVTPLEVGVAAVVHDYETRSPE